MEAGIESLFRGAEAGDGTAARLLFTALYEELRRVAERQLGRQGGDLSLGTTSLLHEAYLDLVGRQGTQFPDRAHFLAYASRAMRTLVIDYGRSQRAQKRGGEFHITSMGNTEPNVPAPSGDLARLESLDEALDELATLDVALAQLVDLHFFCGFTFGEIAVMRGVSERTVQRDWRKARLLLYRVLRDDDGEDAQLHAED